MSAVSAPVSMPYGVTAMTGIATSIACSAMTAVAQSPTNTALPPLLPPAQTYATAPSSGPTAADAGASARSLLVKARAALSEGKNEVAVQALAQASLAAQQVPEMASELQQTRQQFVERAVSQQALDQAMRVAQTAPGLTSRAANALRNNNPAMLPPANGQMVGLPPAMPQQGTMQAAGPANPLRDQAAGLAAEAKMALVRGDTANARQLVEKAKSLRVQESDFAPGQIKPWEVALMVDRAERLRGSSSEVITAGATQPVSSVQNANGQSPFGATNNVQPGVYQPHQMIALSSHQLGNHLTTRRHAPSVTSLLQHIST